VLLIKALLTSWLLHTTYDGRAPDQRIAEATPDP
jgi:hypothetical protein